ncbi:MAG: PAS domain S-box protein [Methanobacteriota archaeon]
MTEKIQLLYVDDEPCLLEIAKLYLEKGGTFSVETLSSACDALKQLNLKQYDVIISDYQMPDMDGIMFLKQLKASGNITPFIIFTGRGREEVVIEALNNGADFYIQKGGELKSQFAELSNKIQHAVTQRQVKAALLESEEKFRTLARAAPDGIMIHDKGMIIDCNQQFLDLFGYEPEEIIGKNGFEVMIHSEYYDKISQWWHSGAYDTIDIIGIKKDGTRFYGEIRSLNMPWQGKKHSIIYIRDVSSRKENELILQMQKHELHAAYEQISAAEEELRVNLADICSQNLLLQEKETQLTAILESTADGILAVDIRGKILHTNRKFSEIWKVPQSIINESDDQILLDFVLDQLTDPCAFLNRVQVLYDLDTIDMDTVYFKDGRVVERHSIPIIMDKVLIGRVWSFRDITERRQTEQALRVSEVKLRAIVESLPLAFPDEEYRTQILEEWVQRIQRSIDTQSPIEPMDVVVTCYEGLKKNISGCSITLGEQNTARNLDLDEYK